MATPSEIDNKTAAQAVKLYPGRMITLYELLGDNDITVRLHSDMGAMVIRYPMEGDDYYSYPCEMGGGVTISADEPSGAPNFRIANAAIQFQDTAIDNLASFLKNPVGWTIRRTRVMVLEDKSGDNEGEKIITSAAPFLPQEFRVARVIAATSLIQDMELSTPLEDIGEFGLPRRAAYAYCSWQFKDNLCGYVSPDDTTSGKTATSDTDYPSCNKTLEDCRLRHNKAATLPFGGFVGQ